MGYKNVFVIAILIASILVFLFLVREDIITATGKTLLTPGTYKRYKYIDEHKDPLFEVSSLHDDKMFELNEEYRLFKTHNGNYLLKLDETRYPAFQTTFYKINPAGEIINTYKLPKSLQFFGGFILGKGTYSNWLADDDLTVYSAIKVDGRVSKDKYLDLYNQATAVYGVANSESMMRIEGKWYFVQLDSKLHALDNKTANTDNILLVDENGWPTNFAANTYATALEGINSIPTKIDDLALLFFEKLDYRHSGSSQKIGSPAGGKSWPENWKGTGYFSLQFNTTSFNFKHPIRYVNNKHLKTWYYEIPFDVFKTEHFSIISTEREVYLVRLR